MSGILEKSDNDGTGDRAQSETAIPLQPPSLPGPGILTVELGLAYHLSLPDDPDGAKMPYPGVYDRWRPYAIAEYEGFQLSTEALAVGPKGVVSWASGYRLFKFDVSASPSSELTISMFAENTKADASERHENPPVLLGLIKLNPFLEILTGQNLDVQNGTGKVAIKISYTQKRDSPLETWGIGKFAVIVILSMLKETQVETTA
ncbi:hypothetical protein LT330_003557 [Penicillium expansum]|nr:hypothetical protein LT330_003557 [Penicillium expansum]